MVRLLGRKAVHPLLDVGDDPGAAGGEALGGLLRPLDQGLVDPLLHLQALDPGGAQGDGVGQGGECGEEKCDDERLVAHGGLLRQPDDRGPRGL